MVQTQNDTLQFLTRQVYFNFAGWGLLVHIQNLPEKLMLLTADSEIALCYKDRHYSAELGRKETMKL